MISATFLSSLCVVMNRWKTKFPYGLGLVMLGMFVSTWILGCGESDPYDVGPAVPVTGAVTFKGKSLKVRQDSGYVGRIWFHPDRTKGNNCPQIPYGNIDSEGRYRLSTRGIDGAPVGWYKVMVVVSEPFLAKKGKKSHRQWRSVIPARFSDPETARLAVEVIENAEEGRYDLKLK